MKSLSIYLFAMLPAITFAQSWLFEASVKPNGSGYQDIYLPASITCRLAATGGNIRLFDSNATEVPFIQTETKLVEEEASIEWMPHNEDDYSERWYSRSFFKNTKQLSLDRIVLKIMNANVHQDFWLSGSDDMIRWYIIQEDYGYDANYDPKSTWNLLTIHFPPTDYKYYKVEIRHYWREPIQIMGAGYYAFAEKKGNSQMIPDPRITQREDGNQSIVDLQFEGPHYFDQMLIEVDGPELYLRNARLQRKEEDGNFKAIQQFQLSSKALNQLLLDHERGSDWRLVIDNKDDKPIRIAGILARQRQQYLTTKLEPKSQYQLRIGEESLRAPEYDLTYFQADLPKVRPSATIDGILDLSRPLTLDLSASKPDTARSKPAPLEVSSEKPIYQQPLFLWVGIGVIVLLVGGMSVKLLQDMKNKEG